MPKQPSIKWTQNQQQNLTKAVAKYNAKITRTIKAHPEMAKFLPEKLNVKDQKAKITTAKDLRFLVKSVDRFFEPQALQPITSDTGITTTKWEVHETKLKVNRINRQRAKELEAAAPSTERGTMGTVRENNLQPKKFDINKIKKSNWDSFKESVDKQVMSRYRNEKAEQYKANYLQGLDTIAGNNPKAKQLKNLIAKVDADTMVEGYYADPLLQVDFFYDPQEADDILDAALEHWTDFLNGNE